MTIATFTSHVRARERLHVNSVTKYYQNSFSELAKDILLFQTFLFPFQPLFHVSVSNRLFHIHRLSRDLSQLLTFLRRSAFSARRSGTDPRRARGPLRVLGRVINRRALSIRGEVTLERQRTSEQVCACVRRTQAEITTGPPGRARSCIHEAAARRPGRLPLPVTAGRPEFRGPLPDTRAAPVRSRFQPGISAARSVQLAAAHHIRERSSCILLLRACPSVR